MFLTTCCLCVSDYLLSPHHKLQEDRVHGVLGARHELWQQAHKDSVECMSGPFSATEADRQAEWAMAFSCGHLLAPLAPSLQCSEAERQAPASPSLGEAGGEVQLPCLRAVWPRARRLASQNLFPHLSEDSG